ncbi:MAG: HEAT repeat domain-containing protein [Planctomycetaceae bacterium]|nr:HEAT repeat domain-containing protein [Planctomycetaceae bacterium]
MPWNLRNLRGGLALLGLLAGCQAATEPESHVSQPAPVRQERPATEQATAREGTSAPSAPQMTAAAPVDSSAQRAFDVLTTPGTSLDDWDAAQQQLLEMGAQAAPVLAAALRSEIPLQRESAATTLVLLGPDAAALATTELLQALNDDSDFVRANAAAALLQVPDQAARALPTLVQLLQARDSGLRQMAAMNLRSQPLAAESYLSEVLSQLEREAAVEVAVPLIELLGAMGPAASAAVSQLQPLATSADPQVSQAASLALQRVQGEIQQTQAELPAFE